MRWSSRRIITVLLLVAGLATVAEAAWIPLKARLAQVLLEHAWDRARGGEIGAKPWSWADTTPVAKLRIPGRSSEMIVLEGASGRTLAFGPGHMNGTPLPGSAGNSVVAGHRDTHFRMLEGVGRGDRVEVDTIDGRTVAYVVTAIRIVTEDETEVLRQGGPSRLTLLTCYPFDAVRPGGPMRYVVVALADDGIH